MNDIPEEEDEERAAQQPLHPELRQPSAAALPPGGAGGGVDPGSGLHLRTFRWYPSRRSRGTQRWMKLRTTVQLTGAVTSAYKDKKPPLKREDSFLKRFSTRQTAEFSDHDYSEDDGDQSAGGNAAQNAARRRLRAARRSVINPDENFYFWWLTAITGCVLYNCWTLIVRQAFPELQEAAATMWNVADGACDLLFLADLGFQFRTGYLEQGLIVYDSLKLARHYVKSRPFLLDMLSMFPLDLLRLYIPYPAPLLRFPRFLKVYRSYNYYYMVESRTLYPNLWRVVNLIHVLLLLAHWFGCFYFLLSQAEGFVGDWVYPCPTGDYASLTRKYLGSLYWSTLTLTTIGDLPTPETNLQRRHICNPATDGPMTVTRRVLKSRVRLIGSNRGYLFTIVSYLIGVFIFATIVGQVGNVITNRNANRLEFERLLDGAKLYMRHHKVPRDMQRRVQRWYDYTWSRGRMHAGGDINTALGILPDKLKTELALHVNLNTLKKVTIFQECQPEFLHDLVLKMKAYIFTPGDLICRKGEVAREMFIIADGILEVISETGKVLTTMKAGDFFGEIGILNLDGLNRRTADVRSVGYAELFSLSRDDVLSAMKDYPEAQEILQTMGKKRLMEARKAAVNAKKEMAAVVDTLVCPPPVEVVKEVSQDSESARQKAVLMVRRLRKDAKDLRNYLMKGSTKGRANMMGSFKGEKSDDVRIEMEAMNSNSRDALRMSLRRRQAGGSSEDKRSSIDKEDGQHDSARSAGRRSESFAEQGSPALSSARPAPTFLQRVLALKNEAKEDGGATGSATAAITTTSRKPSVSFDCPRRSIPGVPAPETQPPSTENEATVTSATTTIKPAGIGLHWRKLKPEVAPSQPEAPATTASTTGTTTATPARACASLASTTTTTTSAAALRRSSISASEDPKSGNIHHHPECSSADPTSGQQSQQQPPPPSSSTTAVQAWTATVSPSMAAFHKPSSTSGGASGSPQTQTTVALSDIDKPSGNQLPDSILSAAIQGLTSSNEKHVTGSTLESMLQLQNLGGAFPAPTSLPRHMHAELIRASESHAVKSILKHLSRSESDVTDLHQSGQGGLGVGGISPSSKSKLTKTVSFRDQLEQINALAGPEADFRQQECVAELLVGIKQALQIKLDDIQNQFKTRLVALETAMLDKQDVIQNLEAKIQEMETKRALDEDEDERMSRNSDGEECEEGDVQGLTHPNYVCHPRRSWPMLPSRQRLTHQRSQEEFLQPEHLWRAEFPSPEEDEDDDSDDVTAVGDELSSEDENEELAEAEVGAEGDDEEEEEPEEEEDDEEDDDDASVEGDSESEILDWAGVSRFVRQCKLQQQQKAAAAAMLEEEASGAGSGNDWEIQMLAREMIKNETTAGGAPSGGTKNLSDVAEEEEEEDDLEELGEDDLEEFEMEVTGYPRHRQHSSSPSVSSAVDSEAVRRSLCKQKSWAGAESEHRTASGNRRRDSLPVEDHIIEQFVHSTLRRLDKLEKVFTARTAAGQTASAAPSVTSPGNVTVAATPSVSVPLVLSPSATARSRSSALHHQHSLQDPSSFGGSVAAPPPLRDEGNGSAARGSRRGLLYRGISLGEPSTPSVGLSLLNIPLQPGPPRMPCLTSSLGAPLVPVVHHHHPPPLSPTARLSPLARAMSTINEPMETSQLSDDASDYKNDEEDAEMECSGGNGAESGRFAVATDEQRLPVQSPPTDDESLNECIPECQPLLGSKS